jgi:hypothetical protein
MVISNQERQHPGIVNGKVIPRQGPRPPGSSSSTTWATRWAACSTARTAGSGISAP